MEAQWATVLRETLLVTLWEFQWVMSWETQSAMLLREMMWMEHRLERWWA
jgi:hypothetical protein